MPRRKPKPCPRRPRKFLTRSAAAEVREIDISNFTHKRKPSARIAALSVTVKGVRHALWAYLKAWLRCVLAKPGRAVERHPRAPVICPASALVRPTWKRYC